MLETEFQFYLDHQAEFVAQFRGKYLVIRNTEIIGVYDSDEEAYFQTLKQFEPGTFLIQFCEEGDASYTQTYHSRVAFVK
jgi:hypothetical protein